MKKIFLGKKNQFTLVDDEDYEYLNQWKWFLNPNGYASRRTSIERKSKNIYIHRILLKRSKGFLVDHINRDKLDNRKENLRAATWSLNNRNRKYVKNKSGVVGVCWYKPLSKWRAQASINNVNRHIGYFNTLQEAEVGRIMWMENHVKEMEEVK